MFIANSIDRVMKTVSVSEANQQLSRLLSEVADGVEVVITKRGRPVATLAPYRRTAEDPARHGPPPMTPERKAAIERLIKLMRKGFNLGGIRVNRDEIYDRGLREVPEPDSTER